MGLKADQVKVAVRRLAILRESQEERLVFGQCVECLEENPYGIRRGVKLPLVPTRLLNV